MSNQDKTKVVFRKWPAREGGECIAIFYENVGTPDPHNCQSCERVGQHSACSPHYLRRLRLATPEEYADLKAELEGPPYNYKLDVRKRIPASAYNTRRQALDAMCQTHKEYYSNGN